MSVVHLPADLLLYLINTWADLNKECTSSFKCIVAIEQMVFRRIVTVPFAMDIFNDT